MGTKGEGVNIMWMVLFNWRLSEFHSGKNMEEASVMKTGCLSKIKLACTYSKREGRVYPKQNLTPLTKIQQIFLLGPTKMTQVARLQVCWTFTSGWIF